MAIVIDDPVRLIHGLYEKYELDTAQLSELLSVGYKTVLGWELGEKYPKGKTVWKIKRFLDVNNLDIEFKLRRK